MSLDRKAVENVAHLARLDLREADVDDYSRQLTRILEMVGQLREADTEGVPPMAHPLDAVQRLRPDRIMQATKREEHLSQAPAVADGFYLVPPVIG